MFVLNFVKKTLYPKTGSLYALLCKATLSRVCYKLYVCMYGIPNIYTINTLDRVVVVND